MSNELGFIIKCLVPGNVIRERAISTEEKSMVDEAYAASDNMDARMVHADCHEEHGMESKALTVLDLVWSRGNWSRSVQQHKVWPKFAVGQKSK